MCGMWDRYQILKFAICRGRQSIWRVSFPSALIFAFAPFGYKVTSNSFAPTIPMFLMPTFDIGRMSNEQISRGFIYHTSISGPIST